MSLLAVASAVVLTAAVPPPLLFVDDAGPVTAPEIAAFRSHVEALELPATIGTSDFAYFQTGTRIEGMGHVYRLTRDKAVLDTMLRWTDCLLRFRNDPETGTLDWTGQRELIWKPEEKRTGAEQGIIAAKISYAAWLILESPELWDQTVASGDPHGYGATYRQRALRYVAEMDRTEDTFLMRWFLRPDTDHYAFPADPRYDGGKGGHLAPYNQGWMFSFNKARLARCHEILGNTDRAARYRQIVQRNLDLYTRGFVPVTYDGAPAYRWYYNVDETETVEDVGHAQMGLQGMFQLEALGGYSGLPDRERFANTILYRVLEAESLQWTFGVDGTGKLEEEIRPSYVTLSRWRPELYPLVIADKAAAGRLTTDVETVAYLLCTKQARFTGEWSGDRTLRATSSFESGSARVLSADVATQTVRITPAGDPARGMPTWWHVRIDGIDTGKPLTLEVVARDATTPNDDGVQRPLNPSWTLPTRAAVSTDAVTWTQTAPVERNGDVGIYRVPAPPPSLWLAWGPPFTATQAAEYVRRTAREHPSAAQAFTLGESREGRPVLGLRIAAGDRPAAERRAVWVIARQHAWECGGTWVGLGLSDWLLGNDESAIALRQAAEVFFVPVMDVDHVATGDGGKNALPRDHNRDWSEAPHWPEVAAAQRRILEAAQEKRLDVFLDLHNPSPGASVQTFYVQKPPYVGNAAAVAQGRFLEIARPLFGEIRFNDGNPSVPAHLPIWERISTPWVLCRGHASTVSLTVETPWNTTQGTPDGYREVGRKLGLAVAGYLQNRR